MFSIKFLTLNYFIRNLRESYRHYIFWAASKENQEDLEIEHGNNLFLALGVAWP